MNVPKNLKQGNPMRYTWIKGYMAKKEGEIREKCPYTPTSLFRARFTKIWCKGWDAANKEN